MKRTIIAIAFLVTAACDTTTTISEGDRIGVITKFSHKRLGCGWNWEGEMATQGGTYASGQGQVDENGNRSAVGVWQFSLDPSMSSAETETMVSHVREALNSQHVVRAGYHQTEYHDCKRDSDYMVNYVLDLTHQYGEGHGR